jgi:hypothetical protein
MAVENSVSILKMIDLLDIGGIIPKCLVSDRDLDSPDSVQETGQASKLDGRYVGRLTDRPEVVFVGPPPFLVIDVDPGYVKILPVLLAEARDPNHHRREELAVAGKIVGHHQKIKQDGRERDDEEKDFFLLRAILKRRSRRKRPPFFGIEDNKEATGKNDQAEIDIEQVEIGKDSQGSGGQG